MDFTVAVLNGALASGVAVTLDVLSAANRLSAIRGGPALRWRVIGSDQQTVLSNQMRLDTLPLSPRLRLGHSTLIIPGMAIEAKVGERYDPNSLGDRMAGEDVQTLARLAANHHKNGGVVAATCGSVFVLGEAGLLEGRTATTHWRLSNYLRQRYPRCSVDVNRMVIVGDRVITAGAALAQMDLMMHLIREKLGVQIADLTLKYLLLDERPSQAGYVIWSTIHDSDPVVSQFEQLIEKSLPDIPPINIFAKKLNMSEKTLARRVRSAVDKAPLDIIQAVRFRRARHLLETSQLSLHQIAEKIGYSDVTALRKLTLKIMNVTPSQLRK